MNGRRNPESGQILVLVATALFFVILGAAAVAVDLGNGLLNKQRLQNTADAAALAATYRVAGGGTHADAVAAAQSIVTQNTGGTVSLPDLGTGSDPSITDGIQTSGGDVRVALIKRDVKTFFAGVIGINTLTVTARARAMVNAGGGLTPIAVKRYSAGDTMYQLGSNGNPDSATDYLAQAGTADITSWPDPPWPGLLTQHASSIPDPNHPGPTIAILGSEANPNQAQGNDFHFWVAPDVRNITWAYPPGPTYTNGVYDNTNNTYMSVQSLKNLESSYFNPGNWGYGSTTGLPAVGDQIATLNGVVTGNAVSLMKQWYGLGTDVVAMIYDGTVHQKPDFVLQVSPILAQNNDSPTLGSPTYTVTVHQTNSNNLYYGYGITFSVLGLDSSYASWSFNPSTLDVTGTDENTQLQVTPAHAADDTASPPAFSKTSGGKSFLIEAYDTLNHIKRTASAAVMFGSSSAFMATSDSAYQEVEQGSSGQLTVDLQGYNGYPGTNVQVEAPVVSPSSGITVGYSSNNPGGVQTTTARVRSNGNISSFPVYFDADASAPLGEYVVKIPITYGSIEQDMYFLVEVIPASSGNGTTVADTSSFVYLLGYAAFQIVNHAGTTNSADDDPNHDTNTVWGRAVSDLVSDPSSLPVGSAVRLVGWNQ